MSVARCPSCHTPLPVDAAVRRYLPFCSARCKLLDLSKWLSEEYRVPGPALGDGGPPNAFADTSDEEGAA